MGLLSQPAIFVRIYLAKYPISLGTQTLYITEHTRPRSFAGKFYHPRLLEMGDIRRVASDLDGNYEVSTASFTFDDRDGYLGTMLDVGAPTEYWYQRKIDVHVISQEGLAAGLTPDTVTPVFRGNISKAVRSGRKVVVEAKDVLGNQFSGLNLGRKALRFTLGYIADGDEVKSDAEWRIPVYVGEFSDRGAKDENGVERVSRGLLPVKELCEIAISKIGGAEESDPPNVQFAAPPVITNSGVVGTAGQKTYYYGATIITSYGESEMSNVVALSGASVRNLSNYNWLEGTYDNGGASPYNKVRIWRGESADNMNVWLDEANYFLPEGTFGYADGAAPYPAVDRDEYDEPKPMTPPGMSGAQTNLNIFSIMVVCLGYGYDFLDCYASDLADGAEPKRKLVDAAEHGVTFIFPTDPEWPFPDPWIERRGIRFTAFLARGPKVTQHRDGSVTMAVNICGPHGDNGKVINQAFYAFQFLLNEHCLYGQGTGYRNQDYGTLEPFDENNPEPALMTSSFTAAQELSMFFMDNDVGYKSSLFIIDPEETWRDVIGKFCRSFGARITSTRFGQIKVFLVNTYPDNEVLRHFRERIEIKRTEDEDMNYDEIVNSFNVSYFWDPDQAVFRGTDIQLQNEESIAAHVPRGVFGDNDLRGILEQDREMPYTADADTMNNVIEQELLRRRRRMRYPVITVPMLGLDYEVGDRLRLTDTHGLGSFGDVETPVVIIEHTTRLMDHEVVLKVQDIRTIATNARRKLTTGSLTLSGQTCRIPLFLSAPAGSLSLSGRSASVTIA